MSTLAIIFISIMGALGLWLVGQILFGLALFGIASDLEAISKSELKRK